MRKQKRQLDDDITVIKKKMEALRAKSLLLVELKQRQDQVLGGPEYALIERLDQDFKELATKCVTVGDYERVSRFDGVEGPL